MNREILEFLVTFKNKHYICNNKSQGVSIENPVSHGNKTMVTDRVNCALSLTIFIIFQKKDSHEENESISHPKQKGGFLLFL